MHSHRLPFVLGTALFATVLFGSAPTDSRMVILSCEGDRATLRGDEIVIEHENGIGTVFLERDGTWPASVTIHFAPPFHRRLERFGAAAAPYGGREEVPHRLLEASRSEGVRYELDTSAIDNENIAIGWIAFPR